MLTPSGELTLDGTLTIVLQTPAASGTEIPIIGGSGQINGSYTGIEVISPRACERVSGAAKQTASTYAVLLTVDEARCKGKGLSPGAIAGIAVGAIIGFALLALLALVLLKRYRPNLLLFRRRKVARQARSGASLYRGEDIYT